MQIIDAFSAGFGQEVAQLADTGRNATAVTRLELGQQRDQIGFVLLMQTIASDQ